MKIKFVGLCLLAALLAGCDAAHDSPPVAAPPVAAPTTDREVRIMSNAHTPTITGDTVPTKDILLILFLNDPCPLDLQNPDGMRRAWAAYGAYQLGCWYPTIDDGYVFIGQIASLSHAYTVSANTHPRALLHADGSATITEPNYNSATFLREYVQERMTHMSDHLQDKP